MLKFYNTYLVFFFLTCPVMLTAQVIRSLPDGGRPGNIPGNLGNRFSRSAAASGTSDSLQRRDQFEDSITISYYYPAAVQSRKLDSSIIDFTSRFPIPAYHVFLGNTGTATRSHLYEPIMSSGWDAGFHAFDVYRWKPGEVRFFNTTRPYTELGYLLGGRTEQIIEVLHTQNIKPNWNALFQYRLINSPGFFKNQKTNHNNYIFSSWFQSNSKRYNNYFSIVANAQQSEENGGISDKEDYLQDPVYNDRFNVPVKLGADAPFGRNFFSTALNTGSRYSDFALTLRQQYDLGRKDSLVSDSTVIPLFYPRLRFEHSFSYNSYRFLFKDNFADSAYYKNNYDISLGSPRDTVYFRDKWTELINDFSVYQFPDAKNLRQYIKAGIAMQNLKGSFASLERNFYNLYIHGEYRNKTRNQKWDMAASGKFYLNGLHAADYEAAMNLKRYAGKSEAYIELGFRNTNRTPSFVFDTRSSFYLDAAKDLKKENITELSASIYQPRLDLKLSGNYYLITNYTYFTQMYKAGQEEALFNLLRIGLEKAFRIGKSWVWRTDIFIQQKTGDAALNLPLLFTRNRVGYEGSLGFKKLDIAMGLESRYHSPYKADAYSPVLGRFYFQDSIRISNLPDLSAYVHFRIRSFKAFVRAENLNTVTVQNGFGFRNHNFAAPGYPYPGLVIRLSIYWNFVN